MSLEKKRKIKIYRTLEAENEEYVTKTLTTEILEALVEEVRIEEVGYNRQVLEFSLKCRKGYIGYALLGRKVIADFLEDMQILDNEKFIPELKGRLLNGIFNNNGEIAALGIDFYKREVNSDLIERLGHEIQRQNNEYKTLKENKKLKEEDYAISNELEKLGLLNLNKRNNSPLINYGHDSVNGENNDSDAYDEDEGEEDETDDNLD